MARALNSLRGRRGRPDGARERALAPTRSPRLARTRSPSAAAARYPEREHRGLRSRRGRPDRARPGRTRRGRRGAAATRHPEREHRGFRGRRGRPDRAGTRWPRRGGRGAAAARYPERERCSLRSRRGRPDGAGACPESGGNVRPERYARRGRDGWAPGGGARCARRGRSSICSRNQTGCTAGRPDTGRGSGQGREACRFDCHDVVRLRRLARTSRRGIPSCRPHRGARSWGRRPRRVTAGNNRR